MGKERRRLIEQLSGKPYEEPDRAELLRAATASYPDGLDPRLRRALDSLSLGSNLPPGGRMTAPAATSAAAELPALESLDDAGLQALMQRAGELLKERERAKQREALEQARAILASAGLAPQDLIGGGARAGGTGKKRTSAPGAGGNVLRGGTRYANPANPAQVYEVGRGREPGWFRELKGSGQLPPPLAGGA